MIKIVYVKLIAYREEVGGYIVYVFELINGKPPYDKYVMCTRFPNWESPFIKLGDIGFLKYREVVAGKDTWYNLLTEKEIPYKYTGIHFLDFVYENKNNSDKLIL